MARGYPAAAPALRREMGWLCGLDPRFYAQHGCLQWHGLQRAIKKGGQVLRADTEQPAAGDLSPPCRRTLASAPVHSQAQPFSLNIKEPLS